MSKPRTEPYLPDWLVRNRNFVLLWAAYGVAAFGDHLSEMALLKERNAFQSDYLTRIQALITFGFFLPFVVLGPLAGWWSDRFSRRTTMIAADLIRAVIVFNMAIIVGQLAAWLPATYGDYSIVIPPVIVGTLAAFFSPARQAMLPTLIRDDQLVRANAMISALGTIGGVLAAVVGGYIVQQWGPAWNYHLNAATFCCSAAFVTCIAMSRARAVPHPRLEGVWAPLRAGFRYVRNHARVLQLILLGTAYWAAAGIVISVVPAIAKLYYGENYAMAGTFRGLLVIGIASGAAVLTILGAAVPIPIALLAGLGGAGFWTLALAATTLLKLGPVLTGVCLFGMGGAGAAILVTIMAALQRFVPDSRRGRVFGVTDMFTMAALVAATGLLGLPHIEHLDDYVCWLLAATGVGLLATMALAWRDYRRGDPFSAPLWIMWRLVRLYAGFWCRAKRLGLCTVPRHGPVILAANHTAGIDPLLIFATCPHRKISFLVAREYMHGLAGAFMRLVDCIPLDRERPSHGSLAEACRLLKREGCLGIFPQGQLEPPGKPPRDTRGGAGWLALRSGAIVIPCHIAGTQYSDRVIGSFFHRHHVRVRYGRPVDLSAFRGREKERDAPRLATDAIMCAIRALAPEGGDAATHTGHEHGA